MPARSLSSPVASALSRWNRGRVGEADEKLPRVLRTSSPRWRSAEGQVGRPGSRVPGPLFILMLCERHKKQIQILCKIEFSFSSHLFCGVLKWTAEPKGRCGQVSWMLCGLEITQAPCCHSSRLWNAGEAPVLDSSSSAGGEGTGLIYLQCFGDLSEPSIHLMVCETDHRLAKFFCPGLCQTWV